MIAVLLILVAIYVSAGLLTVAIYSGHAWQPVSWGQIALQFAVWPFLALVLLVYYLGGGK